MSTTRWNSRVDDENEKCRKINIHISNISKYVHIYYYIYMGVWCVYFLWVSMNISIIRYTIAISFLNEKPNRWPISELLMLTSRGMTKICIQKFEAENWQCTHYTCETVDLALQQNMYYDKQSSEIRSSVPRQRGSLITESALQLNGWE